VDRGSMVRIPLGNERSIRVEVRAVAPDANPYMVLYSIFKTGIDGSISKIKDLRSAKRFLPDNIYDAMDNFSNADWTTKLFGADVKARYVDLKKGSADRCPRLLGTVVKAPEIQFHHEVYNQYLWNQF
jgi:glutamine synthetase